MNTSREIPPLHATQTVQQTTMAAMLVETIGTLIAGVRVHSSVQMVLTLGTDWMFY